MSDALFCPGELQFLLWCHVSPEEYPTVDSPLIRSAIGRLTGEGMIEGAGHERWRTTDRGMAHVNHMCELPLPVSQWVLPE